MEMRSIVIEDGVVICSLWACLDEQLVHGKTERKSTLH